MIAYTVVFFSFADRVHVYIVLAEVVDGTDDTVRTHCICPVLLCVDIVPASGIPPVTSRHSALIQPRDLVIAPEDPRDLVVILDWIRD